MKKSLFTKIFSGSFFIIIILASLILFFSFRTIRNYQIDTLTSHLKSLGLTFTLQATPLLEANRIQELDALVKELGKNINTRITVIDLEGNVYADSEKDPLSMEKHNDRPEIMQALQGKPGTSLRFSTTVQEEMLYVAIPMKSQGKTIGVLRVSLFIKDINRLLGNVKAEIFKSALVVILLSLLGATIFSRGLSKPIKELANASRRVASGDFDARVLLKNKGEIKDLAESFNTMTEKIKTLFTDLSLQKQELDSIISSIQEGLLVLDPRGKIRLGNQSIKKILDADDMKGKFYWEVFREPALGDLIKKVTEKKKNFTEEIELNGRVFLCGATFMPSKEEIVLVLYDITEMKTFEKTKKDFIVNVSHELRTPLTALKGYAETLEDEVDSKHRQYVVIIKRNTERLINIVQDLLILSELEAKSAPLQFEEVNLKNVIEDVLKIFDQRAKEKGLALKLHVDENLGPVKTDSFKIEQLLINLIDNAFKYTEKGEITITVERQDQQVRMEIQDTGIGIPQEHIGKIFERFYVVDKSRSKKLGGTGLGLSIVKHIVLLHNGTIDIKSAPDGGTKVTILLPVNPS